MSEASASDTVPHQLDVLPTTPCSRSPEDSGPPTVPATPTVAGGRFLYSVMGGGDRVSEVVHQVPWASLFNASSGGRTPYQRTETITSTPSRLGSPLSSPVRSQRRARGASQSLSAHQPRRIGGRPLARAIQAPIPLCDYPLPSSVDGQHSRSAGGAPVSFTYASLSSPTSSMLRRSLGLNVEDLVRPTFPTAHGEESAPAGLPPSSVAATTWNTSEDSNLASATIAMAVLAAVKEAIIDDETCEVGRTQDGDVPPFAPESSAAENPSTPSYLSRGAGYQSVNGGGVHPEVEGQAIQVYRDANSEFAVATTNTPPVVPDQNLDYPWYLVGDEAGNILGPEWPALPTQDADQLGGVFVTNSLAFPTLDGSYLNNVPSFNPDRPTYTGFDLCMRLGNRYHWPTRGITRTELKRLLRACASCHRFMYAERRAQHRCNGAVLDVRADDFDFIQNMLSFDEHSGYSFDDLIFLLFQCQQCLRVFYHQTEHGTIDDSVEEWTIHRCALDPLSQV